MADGGVGIVYAFSMARYASGKPLAERKRSPRWRDTPKPPFPQPISHTKKQEVNAYREKETTEQTTPVRLFLSCVGCGKDLA